MMLNDYEMALLRFGRINRSHARIKEQAQAIIDWADNEWAAAQNNLSQHEKCAGIELDKYRRQKTDPCLYSEYRTLEREDCGCAACLMYLGDSEIWALTASIRPASMEKAGAPL